LLMTPQGVASHRAAYPEFFISCISGECYVHTS
jgi:hypothetical protein